MHVLSDAVGSIIVVISALVVWKTEWKYRYYMDPALSIVLVILILHSVWPLLRESALILLQTVPTHIQVIVCFNVIVDNEINTNLILHSILLSFIRSMPFRSVCWKRWTVFWPCTSSTSGNWPATVSLRQPTLDVETYPNI